MTTERKPLYLTISDIHQFVLPNTASATGFDLNTGKQLYYNTSSLNWSVQTDFTGSITKLTDGSDYLIASGAVSLTTTSLGAVKILVHEDSGNHTPVLSFSGGGTPTYASQVGRYYKIGRNVVVNFALALSNLNGVSGDVYINNLPFTSETSNDGTGAGQIPIYKNINNSNKVSGIFIHVQGNTNKAEILHVTNPETDSVALAVVNLTNTTQLTGSLTYISAI